MAQNSVWKIDPGHSQVQFKVKHLAIANISGIFKTFEGEVAGGNEDFDKATVKVSIAADSIDTQNKDRDANFRSADFIDAEKFPLIGFEGVMQKDGAEYMLNGTLNMHGINQQVKLNAELTGVGKGRFGDERAGFEVSGRINRKDFGLNWNMLVDGGGLVLGDEIRLHFDIELIRQ